MTTVQKRRLQSSMVQLDVDDLRNRDEADAYMFYRHFLFFFRFFVFFSFFPFATKILDNRSRERIFMKLLPNDSGENGVCIAVPKWGLGPRLIFWG